MDGSPSVTEFRPRCSFESTMPGLLLIINLFLHREESLKLYLQSPVHGNDNTKMFLSMVFL